MSTISRRSRGWYGVGLHNGDCMTQAEFQDVYERMSDEFHAELIDGTVFVCEPVGSPHGDCDGNLSALLTAYCAGTPGIQRCANTTVMLGIKDQVQPDLLLRILPKFQGQSQDTYDKPPYIKGAPELVAEIAYSSRSIDLHLKKRRYENAGVIEYIVVCLEPLKIFWFDLRNQQNIIADEEGVYRSIVFPGLWISGNHLLNFQYQPVMDVLKLGLISPGHAEFAARLERASR